MRFGKGTDVGHLPRIWEILGLVSQTDEGRRKGKNQAFGCCFSMTPYTLKQLGNGFCKLQKYGSIQKDKNKHWGYHGLPPQNSQGSLQQVLFQLLLTRKEQTELGMGPASIWPSAYSYGSSVKDNGAKGS